MNIGKDEWPLQKAQCGNCGGTGIFGIGKNAHMRDIALKCLACHGNGFIMVRNPSRICEPVYTSGVISPMPVIDVQEETIEF